MTDSEASSNVPAAASPNRGVKRGLPTVGLPTAEESAGKLWEVARKGTTSKEAYARQFGWTKASGSHWDTRIALLRGFELIDIKGDQIGLSAVGLQLINVSNPLGQIEARRKSVMSLKAYRELIIDFDGTKLPDINVLASRLQYDYGKKPDLAAKAARAFVDSLTSAQMVDEGNVVHKGGFTSGGEEGIVNEPADSIDVYDEDDLELDRALDGQEDETEEIVDKWSPSGTYESSAPSSSTSVSIAVNLDLSNYRADEVIEILRALGVGRIG